MERVDNISFIGDLTAILNSKVLRQILDERKNYYQQKVNEYVRAKDLISAYGALCRWDDIEKFFEMIEMQLKKLKGVEK